MTDRKEQNNQTDTMEDNRYNYHKAKMRFGLLLTDINDAIREGDGERLLNLYKMAVNFQMLWSHQVLIYYTVISCQNICCTTS